MRTFAKAMGCVFGNPLMIHPQKALDIVAAMAVDFHVAAEPTGWLLPASPEIRSSIASNRPYDVTDQGIALIGVHNTLVHKARTAAPPSGFMTYGEISADVENAKTDPAIRGLLLDIGSPGGEASTSVFDLAKAIRLARQIKPIWAVADEHALSAAYLIASAASRFFLPELGWAGSIGVMALHLDTSEREAKEGDRWTAIFAGARKNDLTPHEPLNEEAEAKLRTNVEKTYGRLVEAVAEGRSNLTRSAVRATEGGLFQGQDAVDAGLADGVASFDDVEAQMTEWVARSSGTVTFMKTRATGKTEDAVALAEIDSTPSRAEAAAHHPGNGKETAMTDAETPAGTPAETAAATPAATTDPSPPQAGAEVVDINAARGEGYAEAAEIAELCNLAGRPDMAAQFMADKKTPAEARQLLIAARAESAGAEVSSALGGGDGSGGGGPGHSPVVVACHRLAEQSMAARGI